MSEICVVTGSLCVRNAIRNRENHIFVIFDCGLPKSKHILHVHACQLKKNIYNMFRSNHE